MRGQDHPPAAGVQPPGERLPAQRRRTRSTPTWWWWTRPRCWTSCSAASLLEGDQASDLGHHGGRRGPAAAGRPRQLPAGPDRRPDLAGERLTQIFRQDAGSTIVENAHRINAGEFPVFSQGSGRLLPRRGGRPGGGRASGWSSLCAVRLQAGFGFDGVNDVQVLSPMYKGDAGATNLNARLQESLNPAGAQV